MKPFPKTLAKISLVLCISGLGMSSEISAAGMPVYDGVHTMQNVMTQLRTGAQSTAEFAKQATRWAQQNQHNLAQLQHIARQLVGVRQFLNLQSPSQPDFRDRDIYDGIDSKCKQSRGGLAGNVLQGLGLGGSGDFLVRQQELCAYRVMARNLQYNNTVALLRRLQQRGKQLDALSRARDAVGVDTGKLGANDNDMSHFMAGTQADMDEWQAINSAYESYIAALTEQGRDLSQTALKGSNPVIGTVVQAATLRAALNAARRR